MFMRKGVLSAAVLTLALAPAAALSGCDGGTETAEEPETQTDQNGMAEEPEPQVDGNGTTDQQAEQDDAVEPQDQTNGGADLQAEEPPADQGTEPGGGTGGDVQE